MEVINMSNKQLYCTQHMVEKYVMELDFIYHQL